MCTIYSLAGTKNGVFLLAFFTLLWAGCSSDAVSNLQDEQYRQIAWNALSDQQKETVITDVDEAKVNRDDTYTRVLSEDDTEEVQAVSVRFNTEDDAILGPIVVYIDPETKEVLGQALRY